MKTRWQLLATEIAHPLPFTIVGSLIAMAGVWWFGAAHLGSVGQEQLFTQSRSLFHLFHPLHICLSAIATTSLFWRFERHVLRAAWVGAWGTILPCGLSDYFFPYVGDRKSVVEGKSVDLGGRRIIKKKKI